MNEFLSLMAAIGVVVIFFWVILISIAAFTTIDLQNQINKVSCKSWERDRKLNRDMIELEQQFIKLEKNTAKQEKQK